MSAQPDIKVATFSMPKLMSLIGFHQTRLSELVTVRHAAQILGVTHQAVYNRIRRGTIPCYEIDGFHFVSRRDCQKPARRESTRRWQGGPHTNKRGLPFPPTTEMAHQPVDRATGPPDSLQGQPEAQENPDGHKATFDGALAEQSEGE